ncbi:hypothetical protein AC1031_006240 [Aphanomyces cochlioides]|nr:hypothetical protein AC1031_006240 [Aphanomyces cochlioides]
MALVVEYMSLLVSASLHLSEVPVLKLLLQRLSNVEKLKYILAQTKFFDYLDALLSCSVNWDKMKSEDQEISEELVALLYSMTQVLLWGCRRQQIDDTHVWFYLERVVQSSIQLLQIESNLDLQHLEFSIVGQICPLLFTAVDHFAMVPPMEKYEKVCNLLSEFLKLVGHYNKINFEVRESLIDSSHTTKVIKQMESPHEYQNNMHVLNELRIPGATKLSISFDPRSSTEYGYDYVTFFKDDTQTSYYGEEKYSGRGEEHNWPGVGDNPPLVIEAEDCQVLFHSDGSGVDWGYKFTVVGIVETHTAYLSLPWLVHVEEALVMLLTSLSTTLLRGKVLAQISSTESLQRVLLSSRLLQGGKQETTDHIVEFLREMIDPAEGSTAAEVVAELKQKIAQDQGSIPHINRAVRAVAAAILHHNLWGMEVIQHANDGEDLTSHVLQAWKIAQKMRQWFDVGDALEATVHRPSIGRPGLKRQPSAYKGQSEEAIMQLCQAVVDRAVFLLEFTPASFSFIRAAKLRWNLIAKYTTAIHRKNSWLHLVSELNAATELKSMLEYRRTSMERLKAPKSITELVLEFVQSDVDVQEMQSILVTRNYRASNRAVGISTIASALTASSSRRLQQYLLEGMARSMRQIGMEDCCLTNMHFFNSTNGCDEKNRKILSETIAVCLKAFAQVLSTKTSDTKDANIESAILTSTLKAMAMDYDVRDSYLLYESKVLPHILRLLPSEDLRIRRAAQAIIRVLLAHFVAVQEDHDDVPNLSSFQKQLLAAVRLQLEGVVASAQRKEDGICLTRNQSGPCAPYVPLLPNHSISFWLFVEEPACQYALKIGDEVRRGPHWISTQDEDGGENGLGNIVAITSPTTVQVKWSNTNQTTVYTWDPSIPLYEVQLVDEGVGGMLFLRGNRNLVCDTDETFPWSHFGLFLTDEGQLKYVISSGVEKDTIFESTDTVHMNAWNHICLVKEDSLLQIYLNGSLDSQHRLEDTGKASRYHRIIQSDHPCMGSGEINRWPIHFPGAKRLVVTFDPLTQLDKANGDYICFFVSNNEEQVWGASKYTNTFPGVGSEQPLLIPSDSALVYLHSSSSTMKWGFRLLVGAEYDDERHNRDTFNPFPFYFGEPPARVLDAPSARGWISQFAIVNSPLSNHEIALHMRLESQESMPTSFPIDRALQTLGLIQTCIETQFGRKFIINSALIRHLLVLSFMGAVETQCGALYVLAELAPSLTTSQIDEAFEGAFPSSKLTFIETVWEHIGAILNVWPQEEPSIYFYAVLRIKLSAQNVMSLFRAYTALIVALAKSQEWLECIYSLILSSLDHNNCSSNFNMVLASIATLGGSYDGVGIGSRVGCCVNIDGKESIEVGSVIQFRLKGETRMANVLFDCDTSRPVDVPIADITVEEDEHEGEETISNVWDKDQMHVIMSKLEKLLYSWHFIHNHTQSIVRYKPMIKTQDKTEVLESEHPYLNDTHQIYTLEFPGAESIEIIFDTRTATESDCDFIRFQKRDGSGGVYGDDKYSGCHFPGIGSVPPLQIPSSSVDVIFHSDSSNTDWGFRLSATAKLKVSLPTPEIPPRPSRGAWSDLRARIYKLMAKHTRVFAPSWSRSMISEISQTAVSPYEGRCLTSMPKSQVFESKHPYANSISEYMAVTFKGANMLTISFDPLSRTEHGCDYVVFFKDKSLGDRWGEYQYTGRAGTENWPGCGGRPPLIIPAEGFTLLWCTDSSNVDWGWKFIVKANFPSVSPLELTADQLSQRAYHMSEMLYEETKYQKRPLSKAFHGFERDHTVPESKTLSSAFSPPSTRKTPKWYRAQASLDIALHENPDEESAVLVVLCHHEHVRLCDENVDWFKVETRNGYIGWLKKRKGDNWLVYPIDGLSNVEYIDEDTVIMSIDDKYEQDNSVDDTNEEQEELASFTSHFTLEELKGHSHRLHALAVETYDALAIQCARHCLRTMFSISPCPFIPEASSSTVLVDIIVTLLKQSQPQHDDYLKHQLHKWIHAVPMFLSDVLSFATSSLYQAMEKLPKSRAIVRTLESPHPYNDNTDAYWRVDMPGATRIKVVFDPLSKTEAGCDWLCFYSANDRSVTYGEAQYSGRGGSENWPGFGNRPPLIIDSDCFEVYFHTDGSGTDWGWAFTAFGIVSDDETNNILNLNDAQLGCWLLKSIVTIPDVTFDIGKELFSAKTLQAWLDYLIYMPKQIKIEVLQTITAVALNSKSWLMASSNVRLSSKLRFFIKKRMKAQHKNEERRDPKSSYLQALVQCSLALDYAIETIGYPTPSTIVTKKNIQMTTSESPELIFATDLKGAPSSSNSHCAWRYEVKTITDYLILGLKDDNGWCLAWANFFDNRNTIHDASVWADEVTILQGDIIHIECDFAHHMVSFLRNNVLIHEILIPASITSLFPFVCLFHPLDVIVLSFALSYALHIDVADPMWYKKVISGSSALSAETIERPCIITRESSHPMSDEIWQEKIHFPNAVKLEIRFDRQTQMGPKDTISFVSPLNQRIDLTGLDGTTMANHPAFGLQDMRSTLNLGDSVVRGEDWIYGDEDGGPGHVGHAVEVVAWKQRSGMGVKVKWSYNNHENIYRYGYNGYFDVAQTSTATPSVIWMTGDTVTVTANPFRLACTNPTGFQGSLDFNRQTYLHFDVSKDLKLSNDFSIQFWIRLADFKDDKRSQTVFFAGSPIPGNSFMHLSVSSKLKFRLVFKTDDFVDSMSTESLLPSHTWTHMTIASSGSDVTIYKFGEKWAHHTFFGRSSYNTCFNTMYWGHVRNVSRDDFKQMVGFGGQLYDIQLWNAPLLTSDIRRTLFERNPVDELFPTPKSISKWSTVNNTGKDFLSIRSSAAISNGRAYYEVTLLTNGTVLVGWVSDDCSLRRKTSGIGDSPSSYAIDINRQNMWHNGPRPFSTPSSIRGKIGDTIGCLLDIDRGKMSFTLNGEAIGDVFYAKVAASSSIATALKIAPLLSPRKNDSQSSTINSRTLESYETKVTELMSMGCSRRLSVEALEKNGQNVAHALEWLLHHSEDAPIISTPEPVEALVNTTQLAPNEWQMGNGLRPAVSLGPMGCQGVQWNLGEDTFLYAPSGYSSVLSYISSTDHQFQVFDWSEDGWEFVQARHKVLDLFPELLHRFVLNEGDGAQVQDLNGKGKGQISFIGLGTPNPWKSWIYSPIHNDQLGVWGYRFSIIAHYYQNGLPRTRFLCNSRFTSPGLHLKSSLQLVQYINQRNRQFDTNHILRAPWSDFTLRDEDWVRWPLLCEMATGSSSSSDSMNEINQETLALRFKWLQEFNSAIHRVLPYTQFVTDICPLSLQSMIFSCRGLIFHALKKSIWDDCLKRTQRSGVSLEMTLNRPKAMRQRASGLVDSDARTTLFAQAFRQLNSSDNHHFRRHDNVYYVKFMGENAEDAGGPYRETFAQYASELHSPQIPMFLQTPNAAHNVGLEREKWVVNPSAFSSARLRRRIFEFLGKLMGACVRSKDYFAMNLVGLVWKLLVNEETNLDDLEALDKMLVQSMSKMRTIDQLGVTESMFEDIVLETFTTLSTDNRVVEIKPGGAAIPVTFHSRLEFADLVEHFRLHEFDTVVKYIQAGLAKVLPISLMGIFTGLEFELMVCGSPEVDIELLIQCTEYSSCSATDLHVVWFWNTLRKFSHEERSAFLRFVWGRSRLPHTAAEFPQSFKLQSFNKSPADTYLPVAHTCFFAIEVPAYSSEELLAKKLIYAIYNCQEIDADGDSLAANQLGWDD